MKFSDPIFANRHERRREKATGGARNLTGFEPRNFRRFKMGGGGGAVAYDDKMNAAAQNAVLQLAQPMIQQTASQAVAGNNTALGQVYNFPLRNVGLNTKIVIEVSGTIAQAAAETLRKTQWGLANFFSNIQLADLSNYTRINTSGWHLTALASLRRQMAFGAAFVNDSPVNMGSNFQVCNQPDNVTVAKTFRFFFELPLAYSDVDLRGAIYAAVNNATWQLQVTVNPTICVGSAADATLACYQSTTAGDVGVMSAVSIQIYQFYLDQLPFSGNKPVLPLLSLAYNYLIQNTTQTALVAGQDFPVQYANFRQFLSTIVIYDNAGTLNVGSDINYWGIQAANLTFLRKYDPYMSSLLTRNIMGDDFPKGTYIFDHRSKPINTAAYGNTQLVVNPITVTAGATLLIGYEMLAVQAQAINAGSLPAN